MAAAPPSPPPQGRPASPAGPDLLPVPSALADRSPARGALLRSPAGCPHTASPGPLRGTDLRSPRLSAQAGVSGRGCRRSGRLSLRFALLDQRRRCSRRLRGPGSADLSVGSAAPQGVGSLSPPQLPVGNSSPRLVPSLCLLFYPVRSSVSCPFRRLSSSASIQQMLRAGRHMRMRVSTRSWEKRGRALLPHHLDPCRPGSLGWTPRPRLQRAAPPLSAFPTARSRGRWLHGPPSNTLTAVS